MTNFQFKNKTILIISPEKWGKMMISKHHYAIELAKMGNRVYFLNPPQAKLSENIAIRQSKLSNLFIISFKKPFFYRLKFHFKPAFDLLFSFLIKKITQKINRKIDVLWSFDLGLFDNLQIFNAGLTIFHPVDPVTEQQILPAYSADIIFSISEKILSSFSKINKPKFFINHGLSKEFQQIAEANVSIKKTENIKVGYFGNLLRPILDTSVLKTLIAENQGITFVFWGSYENKDSNIGASQNEEVLSFINFLKSQKNVFLKGAKAKEDLVQEIIEEEIDVFTLVYKYAQGSDRSNAHKLIEYLASGKVIVANLFSTYKDFDDLIVMPKDDDDSKIPILFKQVINDLEYYNSPELQKKRIEFTLDNTYEKQIQRIENQINKSFKRT